MYSRRHLLIRQELGMLSSCMAVNSKEATCLLLFAVLLESNETSDKNRTVIFVFDSIQDETGPVKSTQQLIRNVVLLSWIK